MKPSRRLRQENASSFKQVPPAQIASTYEGENLEFRARIRGWVNHLRSGIPFSCCPHLPAGCSLNPAANCCRQPGPYLPQSLGKLKLGKSLDCNSSIS
jgi:hypothetical protein